MAGHSRPKDGVASLACVPAIHALLCDISGSFRQNENSGSFRQNTTFVMAGLDPAIHVLLWRQGVDARDKRGHDGGE
jgi:hypothetical protein